MNTLAIQFFSKQFLSYKGKLTGMQFGTLSLIHSLRCKCPNAEFFFLWEGFNSIRKSKSDTYKQNRQKIKTDGFHESIQDIKVILPHFGVKQISHVGLEADDMAGHLVAENRDSRILLVSNDADWYQFLEKGRVDIFGRNAVKTYEDAARELGFPPERIVLWKTLKGDPSDGIVGIPRFPSELALRMMRSCVVLEDFKEFRFRKEEQRWKKRINEHWYTTIQENIMLVDFHPEWIVPQQIIEVDSKYDRSKVRSYLKARGMTSLAKRMQL